MAKTDCAYADADCGREEDDPGALPRDTHSAKKDAPAVPDCVIHADESDH